jgi:maltokinase
MKTTVDPPDADLVTALGRALPDGTRVLDLLPLPDDEADRHAHLVILDTSDGIRPELLTHTGGAATVARAGDGAVTALVRTWSTPDAGGRFSSEWLGAGVSPGEERQVSTDHVNRSVATGDVLVKLLTRPAPHPQAVEVSEHLASVGFAAMPEPLGSLTWGRGADRVVVALASRYLEDAQEGWGWLRDLAGAYLRQDAPIGSVEQPAAALGELVAGFHLAMATPSDRLPVPVTTSTSADRGTWHAHATATLEAALSEVGGLAGHDLRLHAADLRSRFEGLRTPERATALLRVHGDLHVGQVLIVDGRLHLTDLDGAAGSGSATGRSAQAPAARDVAALLRSLDHTGRLAAQRGSPVDESLTDRWIRTARTVFRSTYERTLALHGRSELLDADLVGPFEAAQVSHELLYACRHLPMWTPVAHAALLGLLRQGATDGR